MRRNGNLLSQMENMSPHELYDIMVKRYAMYARAPSTNDYDYLVWHAAATLLSKLNYPNPFTPELPEVNQHGTHVMSVLTGGAEYEQT